MFDNIGSKIKTLAKVLTWLGIIGSCISGILLMAEDEDLIAAGLLIIIFGSLISWGGSFLLYGFGQLIENSDRMVQLMGSGTASTKRERKVESERAPQPKKTQKAVKAVPQPSEPDELSEIICPHCGEELYVSMEEESGFFCPFCGVRVTAEDIKRSM